MPQTLLLFVVIALATTSAQTNLETAELFIGIAADNRIHFRILMQVTRPEALESHPLVAVGLPLINATGHMAAQQWSRCASNAGPHNGTLGPTPITQFPHNADHWSVSMLFNATVNGAILPYVCQFESFFSASELAQCTAMGRSSYYLSATGSESTAYGQAIALLNDWETGTPIAARSWEYGVRVTAAGAVQAWQSNSGADIIADAPPNFVKIQRFAPPFPTNSGSTSLFNGELSIEFRTLVFSHTHSKEFALRHPTVSSTIQGIMWVVIQDSSSACVMYGSRCEQTWHLATLGAKDITCVSTLSPPRSF